MSERSAFAPEPCPALGRLWREPGRGPWAHVLGPVSSCVWWGEALDVLIVVLSEGAPFK